jgi:hypothetical protein
MVMGMLPEMKYRRFGRTELRMPVFSCGGMRYQHKWEDVKPEDVPAENQRNLEACIHRALELGINHIETARGYGSSEMQLGWVLPRIPRERLIVQTKVAPDADPVKFLAAFEKSMGYLGLEHVELLSMHGINTREVLDWTLRAGGCLEVAERLRREGRVRFIGFSTHGSPALIREAIGSDAFDYVNLHWYYVNDRTWPCVMDATARDMGVFIISPNDKGGKLYEPPDQLREWCAPLSPMQFNDLYCLARPEVHTLSLGAARPSDFDEHVAALAHYDRAGEVVAPIVARLEQEMERVHGREWCAAWWRGVPEHEGVPGDVNVLEILRLWTYAKAFGLTEWARMRYNLLGNAGHWFPGVKAGEFDEAALRESVRSSPFCERIPSILREAHTLLNDGERKRLSQE